MKRQLSSLLLGRFRYGLRQLMRRLSIIPGCALAEQYGDRTDFEEPADATSDARAERIAARRLRLQRLCDRGASMKPSRQNQYVTRRALYASVTVSKNQEVSTTPIDLGFYSHALPLGTVLI